MKQGVYTLEVENRGQLGTANTRRLRHQGKVPAIVYCHGQEGTPLMMELKAATAVLPVAVHGSEHVRDGWKIRPRKVRLRAGKPLNEGRQIAESTCGRLDVTGGDEHAVLSLAEEIVRRASAASAEG